MSHGFVSFISASSLVIIAMELGVIGGSVVIVAISCTAMFGVLLSGFGGETDR